MMAASIFVSILVITTKMIIFKNHCTHCLAGQHPACAGLLRQAVAAPAGASLAPLLRRGRGDLHLDPPLLHLTLLAGGEGRLLTEDKM